MMYYVMLHMLFDIAQRGGLGPFLKKRTENMIRFSNEWMILVRPDEDGYFLVHYENEIDIHFPGYKDKPAPAYGKVFKRFITEEFGYDHIFGQQEESKEE